MCNMFNYSMNFLKPFWNRWLKVAHIIGNFQAQVILTIFYFIFVLPFGAVLRLFADPLRLKHVRTRAKSNFQVWTHKKDTLEAAGRQF